MKKSSYQKLKEENAQLRKDINTLVLKHKSYEAELIRVKVEFQDAMDEYLMSLYPATPKETIEAFTQYILRYAKK